MWSKWSKWFGFGRPSRPSQHGHARGRKAPRPKLTRLTLESLEERCTPTVSVALGGDNGFWYVQVQCTGGPDTVTVSHSGSYTYFTGDFPSKVFYDGNFQAIYIYGGTGGLSTSIQGTPAPVYLWGHHDQDQVSIGDPNGGYHVQGILAPLYLDNLNGHNVVNVNNQGDGVARTAIIDTVTIGGSPYEQITGLSSGEMDFKVSGTQSVSLWTGTGGTYVAVRATAAFPLGGGTKILGGYAAKDTVEVGANSHLIQNIQGPLSIYAGLQSNFGTTVLVEDDADTTFRPNVTLSHASSDPFAGQITGLGGANIIYQYAQTSSLNVFTGVGGSVDNILATGVSSGSTSWGAPVTLGTASANQLPVNTVNVGNGTLQDIISPLTIYAEYPSIVNVNDSADPTFRPAVTLDSSNNYGRISNLAPAPIMYNYAQVSSVTVKTGSGGAAVNVLSTQPLNPKSGGDITLEAHGTSTVTVGNAHQVNAINGPLTVTGVAGSTALTVDDSNDISAKPNVTVSVSGTTGTLANLAPAPITFTSSSVKTLNVLGGAGNNTYTIAATPAGTSMALNTGGGVDHVNVQAASVPLAVNTTTGNGGGGGDVVTIGSGGSLAGIQAAVTVLNTPSQDQLTIDDSADPGNHPAVTVSAGGVTGLTAPVAPINFTASSVSTLTVTGGSGNNTYTVTGGPASQGTTLNTGFGTDTVNVRASAYPLTVNSASGSGADVITLGDSSNTLSGITGALTLNAAATDSLVLNDQGFAAARTYTVTPTAVAWSAGPPVSYSGLGSLTVNGSAGGDTFDLSGGTSAGAAVTVNGGGGSNTLIGANAGNAWAIAGADTGTLSGAAYPLPVGFHQVGNLTAGSGGDTFQFADGATLSGRLTGGGSDTLDYSAYSTSVLVDLQTGLATGVAGGVTGIQNVRGGNGGAAGTYNLLIGNGNNTLTGGTGRRNILVAGGSASTLIGGDQEDLLIAGSTSYDTEAGLVSWQQIAAYWAGTDDFGTRVSNLTSANGVPLLDATTVTGNNGGNTLYGTGELAWIFTDGADNIIGPFDPASQFVPITP
jgi:hypothetical protein